MSGIKKLAGQTLWYGVSTILGRFISYLLTPYFTYTISKEMFGEVNMLYAFIPFMNVLFTYGLETSFFRFSNTDDKQRVYRTTTISILVSTIVLFTLLVIFRRPIAHLLLLEKHVEYVVIAALIIALDALSTIPFAKLRQDGRPVRFAFVRLTGIFVNIFFVYFFISVCPKIEAAHPGSAFDLMYNKNWGVGYIFIANLLQSLVTLLLLTREFSGFRFKFDKELWKRIMVYSLPLIIVGFGGMINETIDRIMLGWLAPVATEEAAKELIAVYSGCYKLSILITLGVQAFRMGAEPFFFKQAAQENAPKVYARIMKFFVITLCFMFLFVMLYLDIWKLIFNRTYWEGLGVVPILLFANMFLGIYYNLSIWYKLGNKTSAGAYITIIGALITVAINYLLIPHFGYYASAWATFLCYGTMMVISYSWGQKNYRIPYAHRKLIAFMIIAYLVYLLFTLFKRLELPSLWNYGVATVLMFLFMLFILRVEKKEFQKIPVLRKLVR
ncbi:MAG: oligosaccharide flippase family protein [Niabella sp.]